MKTVKVNESLFVQCYGSEIDFQDGPHVYEPNHGIHISLKELKKIRSMLIPSIGVRRARVLEYYVPNKIDTILWAISSQAEIERVYWDRDSCGWFCLEGVRLIGLESKQWIFIPGLARPTQQLAKRMGKVMFMEYEKDFSIRFAPGVIFIGCQTFPNESVIRTIEALEKEIKRVKKNE